jgi:membrane fusion protein (multidrug efflux system)
MKRLIPLAVIILLGFAGWYFWSAASRYESTDDAQVDGHINAISSRIGGYVSKVHVFEPQTVKAGDLLAEIDDRDYQVSLANAEAALADAQANVVSTRLNVPIVSATTGSTLKFVKLSKRDATAGLMAAQRQLAVASANRDSASERIREAEANARKADLDEARYRQLLEHDNVARQVYEQARETAAANRAEVDSQRAALKAADEAITSAEANVEQNQARLAQTDANIESAMTAGEQVAAQKARVDSAEAQVRERRTQLDQARLNVSYTRLYAPIAGIVGKKTVEEGQNVSPGQQLMAIVPADDIWVTANFKETQLARMKPGQRVDVLVDAYNRTYRGVVELIGGATGAKYSLIPPENATGNYVKVVQRVPVRIKLEPDQDKEHRLHPGLSVVPKVYVQ